MPSAARTTILPVADRLAPAPFPPKDPADLLEYTLDVSAWLADDGGRLDGCDIAATPELAIVGEEIAALPDGSCQIVLTIGGGTDGTVSVVSYLLRLASGHVREVAVSLPVRARAPAGLQSRGGLAPSGALTLYGRLLLLGGQPIVLTP